MWTELRKLWAFQKWWEEFCVENGKMVNKEGKLFFNSFNEVLTEFGCQLSKK